MATVVRVESEVAKRKIRGTYVPGNVGKEEAYARIDAGESPSEVLEDFRRFATELVRQENEFATQRAAESAQRRQQASQSALV